MQAPWNAAWTSENAGYEVRPCRFVQSMPALWQPQRPGEGRPMFAEPHIVRQRRSIAEMRCTVCGERTLPGDRWWFEHGQEHEGWYMTTEAPVHRACADLAQRLCPHLRSRRGMAYRFPDGASVLAASIRPEVLLREYGLTSGRPVIGHLKLAFPMSRIRRA